MLHAAAKPAPVLSMDLWRGPETDLVALGDNAGTATVVRTDHDAPWDAPARCAVVSWSPHDGRCGRLAYTFLTSSLHHPIAGSQIVRLSCNLGRLAARKPHRVLCRLKAARMCSSCARLHMLKTTATVTAISISI